MRRVTSIAEWAKILAKWREDSDAFDKMTPDERFNLYVHQWHELRPGEPMLDAYAARCRLASKGKK